MPIDTPAWVRDAVFYQIFPDRFAASDRVDEARPARTVGLAADGPWLQGRRPPRHRGAPRLSRRSRHQRAVPDADLPSAANHRYHTYDYLTVDPFARRERGTARAARFGPRPRDLGSCSMELFNHTGRGFWPFHHILENGADSPYRGWFHLDDAAIDAGQAIRAYGEPGTRSAPFGYRAWWGLPALPKLNTDNPEVREYLFRVAEHWLLFGIDGWRLDVPDRDRRPGVLAGVPRTLPGHPVGRIPRRRDTGARHPIGLRGDRFDAVMNYPLAEAILGYAGGARLDLEVVRRHHEYAAGLRPLDGPAFAARVMELMSLYQPAVVAVQLNLLGSHDAPRMRTVLGGDVAGVRLATLLQATLPGAPCVYYGDEVGLVGGNDPGPRGAFPWYPGRREPGLRESVRALLRLRSSESRPPRQSVARRGRRRSWRRLRPWRGIVPIRRRGERRPRAGGSHPAVRAGDVRPRSRPGSGPRLRRRSRGSDRRRRCDHPRRPTTRRRPSRGLTRSFR